MYEQGVYETLYFLVNIASKLKQENKMYQLKKENLMKDTFKVWGS